MVRLEIRQRRRVSGAPTDVALILANESQEETTIPLPAAGWWGAARLELERPDGRRERVRLGGGPPGDGSTLLLEDSELAYRFALESVANGLNEPGRYRLGGVLSAGGVPWPVADVEWEVEPAAEALVAVPQVFDEPATEPATVFSIARGTTVARLDMRHLLSNDSGHGPELTETAPLEIGAVGVETECLATTPAPLAENAQWVAWLGGGRMRARVVRPNLAPVERETGGGARFLGPLIARPGGGADALLYHPGRRCIEWFRMTVPVPAENEPEPAPGEDFPAPEAYYRQGAIAPLGEIPVPEAAFVASSCDGWADKTAVVLLAKGEKVAEAYFRWIGPERTGPWTCVRVADGEVIPGAAPAVAVDEEGRAWVAMVSRSTAEAGRIGVTLLAFDSDGVPLAIRGTGTAYYEVPEGEIAGAGIRLWRSGIDGSWQTGWCVEFEGGECILRNGLRPQRSRRFEGRIPKPMAVFASAACCAVAVQSPDGLVYLLIG